MSRWGKDGSGTAGATGVERVLDLVSAQKAPAQVCIMHQGRVVMDRAFGCQPDSLFLIYSASKPFVALLPAGS